MPRVSYEFFTVVKFREMVCPAVWQRCNIVNNSSPKVCYRLLVVNICTVQVCLSHSLIFGLVSSQCSSLTHLLTHSLAPSFVQALSQIPSHSLLCKEKDTWPNLTSSFSFCTCVKVSLRNSVCLFAGRLLSAAWKSAFSKKVALGSVSSIKITLGQGEDLSLILFLGSVSGSALLHYNQDHDTNPLLYIFFTRWKIKRNVTFCIFSQKQVKLMTMIWHVVAAACAGECLKHLIELFIV